MAAMEELKLEMKREREARRLAKVDASLATRANAAMKKRALEPAGPSDEDDEEEDEKEAPSFKSVGL
jgi:U3 small nucleolar RNA-associated protein 14